MEERAAHEERLGTADEEDEERIEARTIRIERADAPPEIERTRARIEETRAELGETIEAIKEKLSPEQLAEQAKEAVREATVGRAQQAVSGAMETARETATHAARAARQAASSAGEGTRNIGYALAAITQSLRKRFRQELRRDPLFRTAVYVALGAVIILALSSRSGRSCE